MVVVVGGGGGDGADGVGSWPFCSLTVDILTLGWDKRVVNGAKRSGLIYREGKCCW